MLDNEQEASPEQTTVKDTPPVPMVWPAWPPPPRPRPRQGMPPVIKVMLGSLAALLIVGGLGLLIFVTTNQYSLALVAQQHVYMGATVESQATTVRSLQETAQPLATAQAQIYASATAQAQSTAGVQANGAQATATAATLSDTFAQDTEGTPVLNDPLSDNSMNHQWDTGYTDNNNTGCNFVNNSYRVQEAQQGFLQPCFADATNFSNFVYQVSMTISSGSEGGILFYGNKATGQYYLFRIDVKGNYALELYNGDSTFVSLASGKSAVIQAGLGQSNSLAVIANKGVLSLFVNQTYVASVSNATLKAGQIGVAAYNTSLPVTIDFSSASVWKLP